MAPWPARQRFERAARCSGVSGGDQGAAIVEFLMISVLLVFLLFGVLQVAAVFYVRNVISASASDGARYAAAAGVDAEAGARRASELIARALSGGVSRSVPCTGRVTTDAATGLAVTRVECRGNIKSIFLPIGLFVSVDVVSHSLKEAASAR